MSAPGAAPQTGRPAVGTNPPCPDCRGKCCRSYVVPVTGRDIWRISRSQSLSPEHFLVAGHQQGEHSDGFLLGADDKPHFLALDKKGKFDRYQPCIFLMELAGVGSKCGIYASRPSACRVYPMTFKNGRMGLHEGIICTAGSWPPEEMERPQWREAVSRTYMDFDLYSEVVKRWNARVAMSPGETFTLNEYFSYVLNVYDRLVALEAATPREEMELVLRTWPLPPRTGAHLEELRLCRGDLPWLDYICRARDLIDLYYPHVPPQPVTVPVKGPLEEEQV